MTQHPTPPDQRKALVPTPHADHGWREPELSDFNLDDFEWVPVHRRRRADGWSIARQRTFIETLAATGSVTDAADEAGMSRVSAYRLRNSPDGKGFATAWDIAVQAASRRLIDHAMDRALHGTEEPVFDREGRRIGHRVKYNDRLLMFMLRALQPERFRHAHRAERVPDEALPPPAPHVAEALAMLAPPAPLTPMPVADMPAALELAEILDGQLPARHRDLEDDPEPRGISAEHDAMLEEIKRANAPDHWHRMQQPDDTDENPFLV